MGQLDERRAQAHSCTAATVPADGHVLLTLCGVSLMLAWAYDGPKLLIQMVIGRCCTYRPRSEEVGWESGNPQTCHNGFRMQEVSIKDVQVLAPIHYLRRQDGGEGTPRGATMASGGQRV